MSQFDQNPYQTPSANLETEDSDYSIMQLERFSAWGVFGLSLITFGIYPIYWLYSRATAINDIHEDKIPNALLVTFVITTILSFLSGFADNYPELAIASTIISIIYLVTYLMVLFKVRNRLNDLINSSTSLRTDLSGVLTFFLAAIYLQYKINQAIDEKTAALGS